MEPATYTEAMASPNAEAWKEAMQREFNSLIEYKTWDLVPLPPGRQKIRCKWVFKIKV